MKKVLILALVLFASVSTMFGQDEYSKWAVGAEFGVHSVSDQSAVVTENFNHYGLNVRYNINELVGVGLSGGFDNFQLNSIDDQFVDMNYGRVNAEVTVGLFEILRLRHKNINVLVHGGPGIAFIDSDNHSEKVMNVAGGITGLLKLSRGLAFKVDYTSSIHLSQELTLDGTKDIANAGVNSVVDNLSAGLVFYFGKKGSKKKGIEHADWYVPEPVVPVVNNITQVTEVKEITKLVEVPVKAECNCKVQEYVFFDHDKYEIRKESLNAIAKVYFYLVENEDATLKIYGFASPTQSSAEYNLELSANRGYTIAEKLKEMGIDSSRIKIFPEGKDFKYSKEDMHDIARRVELIVE
jgi:outer membrane protein OmpA-like peptidoglycan-associated protein